MLKHTQFQNGEKLNPFAYSSNKNREENKEKLKIIMMIKLDKYVKCHRQIST